MKIALVGYGKMGQIDLMKLLMEKISINLM